MMKASPMKNSFLLTWIIASLSSTMVLAQDNGETLSLDYDLYVEGQDIGDINIRIYEKNGRRIMVETSFIHFSDFWEKTIIRTSSVEEYQNEKLIKVSHKIDMGKKAYWIKIERKGDVFQAFVKEITNITKQERHDFTKIVRKTQGTNGGPAPQIPAIMSAADALLSTRPEGRMDIRIPVNSFDTTSANLTFYLDHLKYKFTRAPVTIFDTEEFQDQNVTLKYIRNESVQIAGQTISAKHIQLTPAKSSEKPSHIWINADGPMPYFVKYSGEDKDGPFELRLKNKTVY